MEGVVHGTYRASAYSKSHIAPWHFSIHSLTASTSISSPMRSVHLSYFTDEKLKHREAMHLTQSQRGVVLALNPGSVASKIQLLEHDVLLPL